MSLLVIKTSMFCKEIYVNYTERCLSQISKFCSEFQDLLMCGLYGPKLELFPLKNKLNHFFYMPLKFISSLPHKNT